MPISQQFEQRLLPKLKQLLRNCDTPFHVYDAKGIVDTHRHMVDAFGDHPFRQYFAVKALPNPHILRLLMKEGSGLDCSSAVELEVARRLGATKDDIVYTSNNTPTEEYESALRQGAIITFDDGNYVEKYAELPNVVAFRIAPNGLATNTLMGDSSKTKFGVPVESLSSLYTSVKSKGIRRFGIHGMICANELDISRLISAAVNIISIAAKVSAEAKVNFEYINLGGGLGIPYKLEDSPVDFKQYAKAILTCLYQHFPRNPPKIIMECGRVVTGPHGILVTKVINRCTKNIEIIGVDASMSSLMRPAMYGAYHHVSAPFVNATQMKKFDVVGSLCENMDKFAIDRYLPEVNEDEVIFIHDTGAHGHAMGFNYNGRLRPAEFLLTGNDELECIRRAETVEDHLATVLPGAFLNDDESELIYREKKIC